MPPSCDGPTGALPVQHPISTLYPELPPHLAPLRRQGVLPEPLLPYSAASGRADTCRL